MVNPVEFGQTLVLLNKVMFKKVLIANRGRNSCWEPVELVKSGVLKQLQFTLMLTQDSMHVRLADEECVHRFPPTQNSYLNISSIMSAVDLTGAEAIHPGLWFFI